MRASVLVLGAASVAALPAEPATPHALRVVLQSGEFRESARPAQVRFEARGALDHLPGADGAFDPAAEDGKVVLRWGSSEPVEFLLPAGSGRASRDGLRVRLRSASATGPSVQVDLRFPPPSSPLPRPRGTFEIRASRFPLPAGRTQPLSVTLILGDEGGSDERPWRRTAPDRLTYRPPRTLEGNEASALASMEAILEAQRAVRRAKAIDADGDGVGEYGTFAELTAATGVRGPLGFADPGPVLPAALLPQDFRETDSTGYCVRDGYAFMIFLPSTANPAGFVHEQGPGEAPSFLFPVATDVAETFWCAYAQPIDYGVTGRRRFFVNQDGEILESDNSLFHREGTATVLTGNAAFLGAGITSRTAAGTVGNDAEFWKLSEHATAEDREAAALGGIRDILAAQRRLLEDGFIDADGDGKGEHGTLAELTGAAGVRKGFLPGPPAGADFSAAGIPVPGRLLPEGWRGIGAAGSCVRDGYAFTILLPGTSVPLAGYVHETGIAASPSLTGPIGIDAAEEFWCVYAQPLEAGVSGTRRFFANQDGDVLASGNGLARAEGPVLLRPGTDAFVGTGITSRTATGTVGNDGDFWRVADSPTLAAREEEAASWLRRILKAQQAVAALKTIDADHDGVGEFGTFAELTGGHGVRLGYAPGPVPGVDFTSSGTYASERPLLPASFRLVDGYGDVVRDGYVFRILLPGTAQPAADFVHEIGPPIAVSLTALVGVDRSESTWCAYAQPLEYGVTGRRKFFVNQQGILLGSSNRVSRAAGSFANVPSNAAFLGTGITSPIAVGTRGSDGDLWKPVD